MSRSCRPKLGRNFGLLWSGSAISLVGAISTTMAVPLVALELTGSPFYAGLAGFAAALSKLLMQVPAGFIADRVDRRNVMLVAQAGRTAVAVALGAGLWFEACTIWLLIVGIVSEGMLAACFEIAEMSVVPQVVRRTDFTDATSRNEGRQFLATLGGRPLGSVLYGFSAAFPFLAAAVCNLVSAALLARLGHREDLLPLPERTAQGGLREQAAEGLGELGRDLLLRRTVVICALTNILFQIVSLNLVVLALEHERSVAYIGVLLAASGAGGLVGSWLAPMTLDRAGEPGRTLRNCAVCWIIALWLFVFVDWPIVWLFAWALVGFIGSNVNVMRARHQATIVAPERLGLVAGFNQFLTQGAIVPVALLFSGGVIAAVGPEVTATAVAVTATLLMLGMFAAGWHRLRWSDMRPADGPVGHCAQEATVRA